MNPQFIYTTSRILMDEELEFALTKLMNGDKQPLMDLLRREVVQDWQMQTLALIAAKGDSEALTLLLGHPCFQQRLKRVCQILCHRYKAHGQYFDWEDIKQEVCQTVLVQIKQFNGTGSILAYAGRIARNALLDHLRREVKANGHLEALKYRQKKEASIENVEMKMQLQQELNTLTGRQRHVINRRKEGWKLREIAKEMSCSIATVCKLTKQKKINGSEQDQKRKN